MMIEQSLDVLGRRFVGTVATVDGALDQLSQANVDGVVIDRWLRGDQSSDKVVEHLKEKQIPFIVATGDTLSLGEKFEGGVILKKPFSIGELEEALEEMDRIAMN